MRTIPVKKAAKKAIKTKA